MIEIKLNVKGVRIAENALEGISFENFIEKFDKLGFPVKENMNDNVQNVFIYLNQYDPEYPNEPLENINEVVAEILQNHVTGYLRIS